MSEAAPLQCPRCGYYPVQEVDICWACADGVADAARARRLFEAGMRDVKGASRILDQVRDKRALPVILESLTSGVGGRVRRALVSAAGYTGGDDGRAVDALIAELWNTDLEVAEGAVDALADSMANAAEAADALAAAMRGRPELEVKAALALAWRRDQRALPILERELRERGGTGPYNLSRAPGPMLGRLGAPGRGALAGLLASALVALPEEPQLWSVPDRFVRELIDGLVGRYGSPNPEGVAAARASIGSCKWAAGRLEYALAQMEGMSHPDRQPKSPMKPGARTVPRWGMRLRRVEVARPGSTTRFGGQPYFPGEPVWPLHPIDKLPLTFLGQIVVPATVIGDGTWLAHVFIASGEAKFVADPEYDFPVPPNAVIVHPAGRWWGPTRSQRSGPTYAHDWPEPWPSPDPQLDRFRPGPQFGFVISEVDLVPGADPANPSPDEHFETTPDDFNKVGGTPFTLQGGEESLLSRGWKFLASWTAWRVGREMGDAAECYVWVHSDGRGLLDVQGH